MSGTEEFERHLSTPRCTKEKQNPLAILSVLSWHFSVAFFDVPFLDQCVGIWFFPQNSPVKTLCLLPVELHGYGSWTTIRSCTAVSSVAFCPTSPPRASYITFIHFLSFCDSAISMAIVLGYVLRGCSVGCSVATEETAVHDLIVVQESSFVWP